MGDVALVIAAIATVVYALVTALLWADAITYRASAQVAVYPTKFDPTARYVALVAENYGPAAARELDLVFYFADAAGAEVGNSRRHYREPVVGPDRPRRFLPRVNKSDLLTLEEMANAGLHLKVEWSWRHRGLIGRLVRRHESTDYGMVEFRDGLYGGEALAEEEPLDALPRIQKDLHELADQVRRIHDIMDAPRLEAQIRAYKADRDKKARPAARSTKTPRPRGAKTPSV
jgi:hypothetical protein